REKGEEPLATAKRELRDECGLTGGAWTELCAFWTTPGFSREYMHVYLAEGVTEGESAPDDDEEVEVVRWRADEIGERLGEIEDAKTLAGLLVYLARRSAR
ncbi:MAG: ADP-ribose pyrophosphatase, partial [Gaiellaceae bacterium]|nr:ADP-ribose pyrophosphatase [Gaiellaceae bacterium]